MDTAWHGLDYVDIESWPTSKTAQVDDVYLAQPIGFVWHTKPRYRVKAPTRNMQVTS